MVEALDSASLRHQKIQSNDEIQSNEVFTLREKKDIDLSSSKMS